MMEERPGYKTSEFWLSLLVTVAGLVVANTSPNSTAGKIAGIITALLASIGYTYARTSLKKGL